MVRNYKRKTEDRWSKEDLLEALICIKEAKLKINDAARQYGISRATLYRQYQKFILAGGKCDVNQFRTCGGNPILTKVEEDVLEKTIRDLREQGFTVTSSDIKRICFEYCDSNGIPNQFNQEKRMASDDWYYGFLKRHPDVRIPKPGGSAQKNPITGAAGGAAAEIDDILTSADKMGKSKKTKSSPGKKVMKQDRTTPTKTPVHIIPTLTNEVTASATEKQNYHQQNAPILIPEDTLKKPLKRLGGKTSSGKSRERKLPPSATLHTIPIQMDDEFVKAEVDDNDEDDNEDGDDQMVDQEEEVMETEEADEEEEEEEEEDEEEEEEDEEDVADEPVVDNVEEAEDQEEETEDVEMVEEEEEEQDEAEKSESEEEEEGEAEGEEDDAEADEDEEVEDADAGEDQEEVDDEAEADNDAEEGEAEEGEGEEDEEEDEEEEEEEDDDENEDEENGENQAQGGENDESGSEDCTNDDELLEKLLDM